MKKREIVQFLKDSWLHVLLVIFGLALLFNPDGATALVTRLLGWCLVAAGAAQLIAPALKKQNIPTGLWIGCGIMILVGGILLSKPLALANFIGRVFGLMILAQGLKILASNRVLAIITIAAGAALILLPRTLTQTLFAVCGIVMIVVGVVNIVNYLRGVRYLEDGGDPNIIDADQ